MAGFTGFRKSAVSTVDNASRKSSVAADLWHSRLDDGHLNSRAVERSLDSVTNPDTADVDSVRRCGQCLESS